MGSCERDRDCESGECQSGRCVAADDAGQARGEDGPRSPLGSRPDDETDGGEDAADDDEADDTSDDDEADDDEADDAADDDLASTDGAEDAGSCPADCDDGIACTVDRCEDGSCVSEQSDCECEQDADCDDADLPACARATCDDQRRCEVDTMDCACAVDEDCDDGDDCTREACEDFSCVASVDVGQSCDDGVDCSGPDTCREDGSCVGDPAGCEPVVPDTWTCSAAYFGDARCHCGCGATDVDCSSSTADECAVCSAPGSCATSCDDIDPDDNSLCGGVPASWTCYPAWYGDAECDCGCGVLDRDCASAAARECETCTVSGSCAENRTCDAIDATDNAQCVAAPPGWTCDEAYLGDGLCDCGCGGLDVDCGDARATSCDYCSCPGALDDCSLINPSNNGACDAVWTCDSLAFADGATCDCGCGAYDPDCTSGALTACEACGTGSCADAECGNVHPTQNALCAAPSTWTCAGAAWSDGTCDCGCGVVDPDCSGGAVCLRCAAGSCATSDCSNVNPDDTSTCLDWTCTPAWYGDGSCDCGCGAPDSDCATTSGSECGYCWCEQNECPLTTSERNYECPNPSDPAWTCTPAWYGDGYCDCGCGAVDADCPDALGDTCVYCPEESCASLYCEEVDPANNAVCVGG